MLPATHDLVGYAGATLTASSFVPQAVKVIRTRETKDLSLGMWLASALGLGTCLVYGMISNGITVLLATVILVMKIRLG